MSVTTELANSTADLCDDFIAADMLRDLAAERDALSAQLRAAREQEPVAVVTGVYAGRTVVMPLDGSVVLPERMALFSRSAPTIQSSHDGMDSEVLEQFTRWLCIEMPQGTVIGSPSWWAPKIMRAIRAIRAELGGQRE